MERPEDLRSDAAVRARSLARAGFGRGRRRAGLRLVLLALPIAALAGVLSHGGLLQLGLTALLLLTIGWLGYRGGAWGRAVSPGLWAGAVPLACLGAVHMMGHHCGHGFCFDTCLPLCLLAGIAGGLLLARTRLRDAPAGAGGRSWQRDHRLGVVLVGSLTAALGCAAVGLGGSLGLLLGVGVGLVPSMLSPRTATTP